jgi:hypothetical protein
VEASATSIAEYEMEQVERANASGKQPVVFIHGLWLRSHTGGGNPPVRSLATLLACL